MINGIDWEGISVANVSLAKWQYHLRFRTNYTLKSSGFDSVNDCHQTVYTVQTILWTELRAVIFTVVKFHAIRRTLFHMLAFSQMQMLAFHSNISSKLINRLQLQHFRLRIFWKLLQVKASYYSHRQSAHIKTSFFLCTLN